MRFSVYDVKEKGLDRYLRGIVFVIKCKIRGYCSTDYVIYVENCIFV